MSELTVDEIRAMDMGDAIAEVWKAIDIIHESDQLTIADLDEIVDQAKHSWEPVDA